MTGQQLITASRIIEKCQGDLGRKLTTGERRDLLIDNTDWPRKVIEEVLYDEDVMRIGS